jgi:hypothetical protein
MDRQASISTIGAIICTRQFQNSWASKIIAAASQMIDTSKLEQRSPYEEKFKASDDLSPL